ITQPLKGKIIVRVNEPEVRYAGNFWWFDVDNEGWDFNEDTLRMANIKVRIEKSEDSNYYVSVARYSAGKDGNDAKNRANQILYNVSYTDSVLNLGSGLTISKENKFRFQRVIVNIKVPAGKKIRFDETVDFLHPYNVRVYEKRRWQRNDWDVDWDWDNYFDWQTNVDYLMKSDGELVNPNKPAEKKDDDQDDQYRYNDKDQLRQDIKDREQRLDEEKRRLEDDKKRLNDTTKPKNTAAETMEDTNDGASKKDDAFLNMGSPGFSLATMFN
ncbi:MAG: PspC protein, partial [Chitinophagaceae bacterium]|nr:PspC protein [Chitinophagaceae bacterium]